MANDTKPLPARVGGQKKLAETARAEKTLAKRAAKKRPAAATPPRSAAAAAAATPPPKRAKKPSSKTPEKHLSTSSWPELKRLHSKTYHKTLTDAIKRGVEQSAAKAEARVAANQAKDEYIQSHK